MPPDAAYWIVLIFAAVFGGCVGSFLNVVVYRVPNRLSLVTPPSHCPMCKTPIRWYDNVPVFGWIKLGGRCRQCHCWIPIRYPAVEAFTAAMFAGLAVVENPLAAAYLCHLLLLCTLLCAALIEIDGDRPPLQLFIPALIIGIVVPWVWPTKPTLWTLLHPLEKVDGINSLLGLTAGLALSGVLGLVLAPRKPPAQEATVNATPLAGLLFGLICTGLFLGWFALSIIALVTLAVHGLLLCPWRGQRRACVPPSVWLLVSTIAWLLVPL
jgi:leader peptidase (prepilin peptidase) / N-methyltransferase